MVLPILHLNGAKIGGPTVLARKPQAEVRSLFQGHGYDVIEVEGRICRACIIALPLPGHRVRHDR